MQIEQLIIGVLIVLCFVTVIIKQQRTIDKLTDKLMARSYGEYKSLEGIKEEDASPAREEESKGWFDH